MAKTNTKVKGTIRSPDYVAVTSREEAEQIIREIGEKRRDVLRIEADMNDAVVELKQGYEQQAQPFKTEVADLITAVQNWVEQERDSLTNGGKTKTVKLATGEVSWRNNPPKVGLRGKDKIMASLKNLGLQRFIRTSEDIDKEAMLKEPKIASEIAGVTIGSAGETLTIEPYEVEIEDKK